jgi:hypothetical protein
LFTRVLVVILVTGVILVIGVCCNLLCYREQAVEPVVILLIWSYIAVAYLLCLGVRV